MSQRIHLVFHAPDEMYDETIFTVLNNLLSY